MAELVMQNWMLLVVALLIGIVVAWWVLASSSRKRVTIEREETPAEQGAARRNQALIDAAPAASARTAETAEPVVSATPPSAPPASEAPNIPAPSPSPEPAKPAPVPTTPPAAPAPASGDDLTRIKGLGPKLAEQLRGMGVTSFSEIAAWSDSDIDRIDEQLGRFRGRIRRDDWPAQARFLANNDTAGYEARFGKL